MNNLIVFLFAGMLSIVFANLVYNPATLVETCSSPIYCYGPLLETVQLAQLFPDSKTFVDMKLISSPNVTLAKFQKWQAEFPNPTKENIADFVQGSFQTVVEYEAWIPSDFTVNPAFLNKIANSDLRAFGQSVHNIWPELGRQMVTDVAANPDLYSVIPITNPVIVPGGRFREFYYWDSYWIIKGLLVSEMTATAKGMLQNFGSLVKRYGFIPSGGRIYYLRRSGPPLYIPMMHEYYAKTQDLQFVKDNIGFMETEFNFWMKNQTLMVNGYRLAAYGEDSSGPRPEAYAEDVAAVAGMNASQKQRYYSELKAASESGIDFSSRWFIRDKTNEGSMADLKCRSIVPVDLNAILFRNAGLLSEFFTLLGQFEKAIEYQALADIMKTAITAVFWDETVGIWLDWDLENNLRRNYFSGSNLVPLWALAFDRLLNFEISSKVIEYISSQGLMGFPGGVPYTLQHSGEQWDYPNAWAPMMHFMVDGLENLLTVEASNLAFNFASTWIQANAVGLERTTYMYEKYDASKAGQYGEGGEYTVQTGFGWTNGVVLDFLNRYGDKM